MPATSGSILDLGCGTGRLGQSFSGSGIAVDGITLSDDELHQASKHYRRVWQYDLEAGLPKSIDRYDVVFMSHILEHIADPNKLMQCIVKVLNPRGVVLCAIPNMLFLYNRLKLLVGKVEYEEYGIMDYTHLRWYTNISLIELFEKYGFVSVSSDVTGNTPFGPLRRILPEKFIQPIDEMIVHAFPGMLAWEFLHCFKIANNS